MSGSSPHEHCQVAIVGAGPVGLWLALRLCQQGLHVRVLEQRASPSVWSRAIGVHPPALGCLAEVGVLPALRAEGVQLDRASAFGKHALLGEAEFSTLRCPEPYVLSVPQSTTERLLEAALKAHDQRALSRGCVVTHVVQSARDACLVYESEGHAHRLRAELVVGCDGKHSLVRRALHIPFVGGPTGDGFLMGDVASDRALGDRAFVTLTPAGVAESFPLPGQRRRWVVRTGSARPAPSAELLSALIGERTGHCVSAPDFDVVAGFEAERFDAPRWLEGRAVLCGDSAHIVSPLGGQGMNLGLLDARALAHAIQSSFARTSALERALNRYERDRAEPTREAQRRAALYLTLARPGALRHALATRALRLVLVSRMRDRVTEKFAMV